MKEVLQFAKKGTTKNSTEISGSNTFYFKDSYVYAYNNMTAIKAKTTLGIEGSINAEMFQRLLENVNIDVIFTQDTKSVIVKYGTSKTKFSKEKDGLAPYLNVIFPENLEVKPIPSDFLKGLTVSAFQRNSNKISGICIDDKNYYAIDKDDIAVYKAEVGVNDTYWLSLEGVELLNSIPETIKNYSATRSFFYVYTDTYTVAVKLLFVDKFPLKTATKFMKAYSDFSKQITVPQDIVETLKRIKLASSRTRVNGEMMCKITTGKDLIVESMHNEDMNVVEHLVYENIGVEEITVVLPIDGFLELLKESLTLFVIVEEKLASLIVHEDTHTHILRAGRE